MKTAKEIFNKYENKFLVGFDSSSLDPDIFKEALTEHDKEIEAVIDEMIEKEKNITMEHTAFDAKSLKYFIQILTELKNELEMK